VDLFADRLNHTEAWWCSPRCSAWWFDWNKLYREAGCLWANPPFSRIKELLTKVALEGCQVVVITPEWSSGEEWKWLLDRLTIRRRSLSGIDGMLYGRRQVAPCAKI